MDRIKTQVSRSGLIQIVDCLAVLFRELARDPNDDFGLEASGVANDLSKMIVIGSL